MATRYVLFDTNALSIVLKEATASEYVRRSYLAEGWLPVFHPINELELSRSSLLESFYCLLSDNSFAYPKQPELVRNEEIANYARGGPTSVISFVGKSGLHHSELKELATEAATWGMSIDPILQSQHSGIDGSSRPIRQREPVSPVEFAKKAVDWKVRAAGFSLKEPIDYLKLPGLFSEALALGYKYLQQDRQTSRNDLADLNFFYLLPYVNVFITERNNAAIARQIQKTIGIKDLVVLIASELSKTGRA